MLRLLAAVPRLLLLLLLLLIVPCHLSFTSRDGRAETRLITSSL